MITVKLLTTLTDEFTYKGGVVPGTRKQKEYPINQEFPELSDVIHDVFYEFGVEHPEQQPQLIHIGHNFYRLKVQQLEDEHCFVVKTNEISLLAWEEGKKKALFVELVFDLEMPEPPTPAALREAGVILVKSP